MIRPHRTHSLWYAFVLHRLSGIALALFLPLHFYMLSLALTDPAQLDGFLAFTDLLIVKCAEFALVFLLALHMLPEVCTLDCLHGWHVNRLLFSVGKSARATKAKVDLRIGKW